ncbi:unnamed protein product, partial [Porites lobata]
EAYETPSLRGSLGGVARLAQAHGVPVSRARAKLQGLLSYTLHKPRRRRFPTLPVVWQRLYGTRLARRVRPKWKAGDRVRLQKQHRPFEKGYLPGWTEEVFLIDRAVPGPVDTYKIKEWDGTPVKGTFYEQDVQKVDVPDDALFRVEKVLQRRRQEVKVRWKGWPKKYDSWIPKRKFPTNTTSSFKVRLPVPLELKGEGWKVGLAAISTPDATLDLSKLVTAVNPRVFKVGCKLVDSVTDVAPVHHQTIMQIKDILHDPGVVDGVSLMKVLIRKSQLYEMKEAQAKSKRLYDRFRVTYEWDGEDLRMLAKELDDIALTTGMMFVEWHVHVTMAKLMGWLVETKKDTYALGPNLRYELIYKTQKAGNYFKDVKNTELNNHDLWKVESDLLQLSQTLNWRFSNLNVAFRNVVGEPSRTFLVYSDLVDSNIVGGQQHALVREVEYRRLGQGVAYFEPLHI